LMIMKVDVQAKLKQRTHECDLIKNVKR